MSRFSTPLVLVALVAGALTTSSANACHRPRVRYCSPPVYVYPTCTTVHVQTAQTPVVASRPAPAKTEPKPVAQPQAEEVKTASEALVKASRSFTAGRHDDAIRYYSTALELDPRNMTAYKSRGIVHLSRQNYAQATSDLQQASTLSPNDPETRAYLAFIYGACPSKTFRDGEKAIEQATKACELTQWKNPEYIVALATAYAQAGDFDEAVKRTEEAIKLAGGGSQEGLRVVLAQFQKGQAIP